MGHDAITEFAASVTVADLEADPYPIYERLRRDAPVCYIPAVRLWFVTRYDDVEFVGIFRYRPATSGVAPAPRTGNLAFGAGRHFCAGHAFSRAQVRIAIETLIRRFPKLAADPARPAEFRGWEFRAPRRLDVLL